LLLIIAACCLSSISNAASVSSMIESMNSIENMNADNSNSEASRLNENSALEGPIDPEKYLLGPGDELNILLYNADREFLRKHIQSDGSLLFEGLGRIDCRGIKLIDLQGDYSARIMEWYMADSLDIWISNPRKIKLFIGGVAKSMSIESPYLSRASDLMAELEFGSGVDFSLRRVMLKRDQDTLWVDLEGFYNTGDLSTNPVLASGDQLIFYQPGRKIKVEGPFNIFAEEIETVPGDTPAGIVRHLGGFQLSKEIDDGYFVVSRQDIHSNVIFEERFTIEDPLYNELLLEAGDRLYFRWENPEPHFAEVEISGEVNSPGMYPITVGKTTLDDIVQWAGIHEETADISAVRVYRERSNDPEFKYFVVAGGFTVLSDIEKSYYKSRVTTTGGRISNKYIAGTGGQKIFMEANDKIVVPVLIDDVELVGAVRNQGRVKLKEGWSVADYVNDSGGKLKGARMDLVRVRTKYSDQFESVKLSYNPMPGDVIFIPFEEKKTAFELFKEGITLTMQILSIVLILRGI
jgi:protein involved in polysaccharide export with SLBB domain